MNLRIVFVLLGLLIGAVAGYLTRPEAAEFKIGGLSVEVSGNQSAGGSSSGGLTDKLTRHILLFALAGGVAGLLAGFASGRRR